MFKWLYDRIAPRRPTKEFSSPETRNAAKDAIEQADEHYNSVVANSGRVNEVVEKLRIQKERNHFGALIEQTMRGGGQR